MQSETTKGPASIEEGKHERISCGECGRATMHKIVKSAEYISEYEDGNFSMTSWDDYQVIECLGCQTKSFLQTHKDTESLSHDDEDDTVLDETFRFFPDRTSGRHEMADSSLLPIEILRIYRETLSALTQDMPVLAGIGIRAIVETVCRERGSSGSALAERINALVDQGVLSKTGSQILHSLRTMGNEAAHEVKPHALASLNAALDVIEHVLTGVYVMPETSLLLNQCGKKV